VLDSGKIVVLVWVDPCSACISDAKAAYDAVQSFVTSHPGKVYYWLSDDIGNTSCTSLNSWASTNAIGSNKTVFDNAGNVNSEANYGGTAMPHVVVLGGTNHHVFYNVRNGANDGAAITDAINQALTTGVNDLPASFVALKVYPNPASGDVKVSFVLTQASNVQLDVVDMMGKVVRTYAYQELSGTQMLQLHLDNNLAEGNYFLRLKANNQTATQSFTIAR
jgi:hypothetical protein